MKNKFRIVIIVFIVLVCVWEAYNFFTKPKAGYVILTEVYNGFEMKKEMEKNYLSTTDARKKILDSLELEIKLMNNRIVRKTNMKASDTLGYQYKIEEYILKKKTFNEDNNSLSQKYDEEIITQLNQYVKDYGAANHYTFIYGTGGNGSLMYADEAKNITKDVIEYINLKYSGKK